MKGSVDNENVRPNLKRRRSPSLTRYRKHYRSNSKNRVENRERGSYRSSRIDPYRFKSRSRSRSNRRSHRSRSRSKHHQRDVRRQEKEDVVTNDATRASQPVRNRLSAHVAGDTKKTSKDVTKKDDMLRRELANYKVLNYSETEKIEKETEANMIVKSLPAYDLKNEVVDEKDESAKDKNLWRYLNVSETFDDELEILARLKGYCLDE